MGITWRRQKIAQNASWSFTIAYGWAAYHLGQFATGDYTKRKWRQKNLLKCPKILDHYRKITMGIFVNNLTADVESTTDKDARHDLLKLLEESGLNQYVTIAGVADNGAQFTNYQLRSKLANEWAPGGDTTRLCQKLNLDTLNNTTDLEKEILLTMLLSPVPFKFPNHAELMSAIRIRKNIVLAARKTTLDFHTTEAERPADYWKYDKDRGFTLIPGKSLITALKKATQPAESGQLYSFSCYRATEYVILLGIAQELESCNPPLFQKLQKQWEKKAIMSGKFHDVFLQEYGSMDEPLPAEYYVPGDRLWFRNPDELSSDVTGYEGSWVFYLGGGLFTNFWKTGSPYTLLSKCLEIYHWRNATSRDQSGELRINEKIVEERVRGSMQNPAEIASIMEKMLRLRDPKGVYLNGGCIDTSREYPRCVCPGTSDMEITQS